MAECASCGFDFETLYSNDLNNDYLCAECVEFFKDYFEKYKVIKNGKTKTWR